MQRLWVLLWLLPMPLASATTITLTLPDAVFDQRLAEICAIAHCPDGPPSARLNAVASWVLDAAYALRPWAQQRYHTLDELGATLTVHNAP